ncbi:MAG: hypothetical protein LBE17_12980 [Treponema sp.]|jgi:type IV secretory pathway VirB2 component (pilin)|nr:hypothetical protein [Treponema sp.]
MKALILGIVITIAAVCAVIPAGLNWWGDVLSFLRGALPVIAVFIGLIAVFIGITDIKDQAQAKKEKASGEPGQG